MTVLLTELDRLAQHWAIEAIGPEATRSAFDAANHLYVKRNMGEQLIAAQAPANDAVSLIERAALAYELIAASEMDTAVTSLRRSDKDPSLLAPAAYRAFELRRSLDLDRASLRTYLFQILQLGSLAYASDRWAEFRGWMRDRGATPENLPATGDSWEDHILTSLAGIWIRLFRKDGWADLSEVSAAVAQLRAHQSEHEAVYLAAAQETSLQRPRAWRLVALYHWARASELLAVYLMQGTPPSIATDLDFHFSRAIAAAGQAIDPAFDVLIRWLRFISIRMTEGSLWSIASVDRRIRQMITTATQERGLFEFLPPQRVALLEQGLLDPAHGAVVVDLPTSAGKTVLAEFRILQALAQFRDEGGWVAYVAPTRALVSQIARRLRRDLGGVGVNVEHLTAAVALDEIEQTMVSGAASFDVLVATPEKLHLLLRKGILKRPLCLLVMDEAQNLEDQERGLRLEMLLATAKRDCLDVAFLLLMPNVPNAADLARWLAPGKNQTVSLTTSAWQPNDRLVGLVRVIEPPSGRGRDWSLEFEALTTSARTLTAKGRFRLGPEASLSLPYSQVKKSLSLIAGAAAQVLSARGTSVVVARTPADTWTIAAAVAKTFDETQQRDPDVALAMRFLETEIDPSFELVDLLRHGVGVHHAGLSDDARSLMEWLAELGKLRVLVATTTITQGLNFPVGSVFLASPQIPQRRASRKMSTRSFWNLAGRAGRVDQDSIGIVGLSCRDGDAANLTRLVAQATEDLVSRLVSLVDDLADRGQLMNLDKCIYQDEWTDFRGYVAHLLNESESLRDVLAETEILLRNTLGYVTLTNRDQRDQSKSEALLRATRSYAAELAQHPERATLADSTGFAPETVQQAIAQLSGLERHLSTDDWYPETLFGDAASSALSDLMGVLLNVPQVSASIEELTQGSSGRGTRVAEMASDWVNGVPVKEIAQKFFARGGEVTTADLTKACRAIYRDLAMAGPWGLSALARLPAAGINFDRLGDSERRRINLLGAMLYHGVSTENGVVMRMASVPRSVADSLGRAFAEVSGGAVHLPGEARSYLESLSPEDWEGHRPREATLDGAGYRRVWQVLSGVGA